MSGSAVRINRERLWADIMALADITDPDAPYTRRSFTPLFEAGRRWLVHRFEAAGLSVRTDVAGNIIARREGRRAGAKTLLLGSHIDTVPSGGRFDGIAGVIAALEVARAFTEAGVALDHPLEVVDFLAEEPSDYGVSCVGSRGMTGALTAANLAQTGPGGETLAAAIGRMGGDVTRLGEAKRDDIAACLELHIEQGPVLESGPIDIGIVSAIVGITRLEIVFRGDAGHAGTAPMALRRDAAVAAAAVIGFTARRGRELADAGNGYVVATTGIIEVTPNAANVVPGHARLVIDLRCEKRPMGEQLTAEIEAQAAAAAVAARVELARFAVLSDTHPSPCDPGLRACLADCAAQLGLTTTTLASGAGHDTAFLTRIAPAAMVFVACKDGLSHCPEEWADAEAIAKGTAVMAEAVLRLDQAA